LLLVGVAVAVKSVVAVAVEAEGPEGIGPL